MVIEDNGPQKDLMQKEPAPKDQQPKDLQQKGPNGKILEKDSNGKSRS